MRLTFHGAADTVTGSKTLVEAAGRRILVDCGLFQGLKELRLRNWEPPPFDAARLDGVVLTHAHLDHSGWLPRLVRAGFDGPVWCTPGTADLVGLLLLDSGHIQEEDARFAARHGFSRHHPPEPLYTQKEAETCLSLLSPLDFDQQVELGGLRLSATPVGHILGAAAIRVEGDGTAVVFSGDVGRPSDPLFDPPRPLPRAENLVLESTYGERRHPKGDPATELAEIIHRVADRGGVLLVPSFAVGRAQLLLHLLAGLKERGEIPDLPVFLDSPMAIDATRIFCAHPDEHRLSPEQCRSLFRVATYVREVKDSKAIDVRQGPMIIIAGSGMATGGRILHHLKVFGPDSRNAVLLVGFQAAGTRGRSIEDGVDEIKIHGRYVPIRAERLRLEGLSAHADQAELIDWLRNLDEPPRRLLLNHGEPTATDALRRYIHDALGWEASIAHHGQTVEL